MGDFRLSVPFVAIIFRQVFNALPSPLRHAAAEGRKAIFPKTQRVFRCFAENRRTTEKALAICAAVRHNKSATNADRTLARSERAFADGNIIKRQAAERYQHFTAL